MKLTKENDRIICPGCGEAYTRNEIAEAIDSHYWVCPNCGYEVSDFPYRPPSIMEIVNGRLEKFDSLSDWNSVSLGVYLSNLYHFIKQYEV